MILLVSAAHLAPLRKFGRLQRRRHAVKDERQTKAVLSNQARDAIEESSKVRGDPAGRVLERRSVPQANQREELIQLAVPVDRQGAAAQGRERDRIARDDRREERRPHISAARLARLNRAELAKHAGPNVSQRPPRAPRFCHRVRSATALRAAAAAELDLVAIQVVDPGEATVGFVHSLRIDLHSLLFQAVEQCIEVVHDVVDHERRGAGIEIAAGGGKNGPHRDVFLLRVAMFAHRKHRALAFIQRVQDGPHTICASDRDWRI